MIDLRLIIYSLSEPESNEVGWLHKINDVLVLSFYDNGEWKCISSDITEELINAETTNRTLADTALDIRIGAEANTRNSADIALSSALNIESSYRANADALLNSDIVAEKTRATTVENTIGTSVGLDPETKIYTNTGLYIGKLVVNTVTSDIKALDTLAKNLLAIINNKVTVDPNKSLVDNTEIEKLLALPTWDDTLAVIKNNAPIAHYNYNIKKTYDSVSSMNADKAAPIGTDELPIKIGDIVTVVNLTTPSENGIYSYQGSTSDFKFQSSFNFQIEQSRSQNADTSPSSKLFNYELEKISNGIVECYSNYQGDLYLYSLLNISDNPIKLQIVNSDRTILFTLSGSNVLSGVEQYELYAGNYVLNIIINWDIVVTTIHNDSNFNLYKLETKSLLLSPSILFNKSKLSDSIIFNDSVLECYTNYQNNLFVARIFNNNSRRYIAIVNEDNSFNFVYDDVSQTSIKTSIEYLQIKSGIYSIYLYIDWSKVPEADSYSLTHETWILRKLNYKCYDIAFSPYIKEFVENNHIYRDSLIFLAKNTYISTDGSFIQNPDYITNIFSVNPLEEVLVKSGLRGAPSSMVYVAFYSETPSINTYLSSKSISTNTSTTAIIKEKIIVPYNCKYIAVCGIAESGWASTEEYINPYLGVEITTYDYSQIVNNNFKKLLPNKKINCIGDSLTMGAGTMINGYHDIHPYSAKLQELLGYEYDVKNQGIGGERTLTIAARTNSINALLASDITLPYNKALVTISMISSFDSLETVTPLLQGGTTQGIPETTDIAPNYKVYVKGIPCTLAYYGEAYHLVRLVASTDVNDNIPLSAGTPIIFNRMLNDRDTLCDILWCGTNDSDKSILIDKIKRILSYSNNSRQIIIGLHNPSSTNRIFTDAMRLEYRKEFGNKFFDIDLYTRTSALSDMNLTPTTEDTDAINNGLCPPQILSDGFHFINEFYDALASELINKMKENGII